LFVLEELLSEFDNISILTRALNGLDALDKTREAWSNRKMYDVILMDL
jgi:hypothetical protein